jgi:AcrR family transcriptional regulator
MASDFGPSELVPHPDKTLLYSSPMIVARRKRLLKEARHMIAESGLEGFSVRKLCQRADVAQRTLYNAFQNKDRLIALAIREAFDEFSSYVRDQTDPVSLDGWIGRTIAINRRNFRVRNYTKAICAIYFAPSTTRDVWNTLQDMSLRGNLFWLDTRRSDINPWIDLDHFAHSLANVQYSTINDWCLGRIADEDYLPRLAESMLMMLVGAVHGTLAAEAGAMLEELGRTGRMPSYPDMIFTPPVPPATPAPAPVIPPERADPPPGKARRAGR